MTAALAAPAGAQRSREYFANIEIERLRDAQGPEFRVPLYFRLADKRLVMLGVKVLTEKELEAQRKDDAKLDARVFETTGRGPTRKNTEDPDGYLRDFTKADLLRGYIEAIDDLMSYIEDAFNRKVDVRSQLELLEKYARANRPLLDHFKPVTDAEEAALEDAIDMTEEALNGSMAALEKIAPTERKVVPIPPKK
jgi:hypothetical protein